MIDDALVVLLRGGVRETEHRVQAAVWSGDALLVATGDPDRTIFLRSAAKPVQAMACVLTGADERFGWGEREIALACASHNAEPEHVDLARAMLASAGRSEADLHCGPHAPIDPAATRELARAEAEPDRVHNNCSGKHAAMIASCVAAGWPIDGYTDPEHPLQRLNRENVEAVSGCRPAQLACAIDGCGAPAFAVPLRFAARWAAAIATPTMAWTDGVRLAAFERTTAAMLAHPQLVGGTRRVDTDLMRATGGEVVCKVGAEGVWCAGVRDRRLGVAVKCRDGTSPAAHRVGLALLDAVSAFPPEARAALSQYTDPVQRNHAGEEVGAIVAELPPALLAPLAAAVPA